MGMRLWDAEMGMGADGDGEVDADGCASSVHDREEKPLEIFFLFHRLFPFLLFYSWSGRQERDGWTVAVLSIG